MAPRAPLDVETPLGQGVPVPVSWWCCFFGAIDHCVADMVGWHLAKLADRWAALEPIRHGVQRTRGAYAPKIALGLELRMDWWPQYTAHQFLGELRWLGIRPSPSFVGEPECNGVMERWIRTLKEECLYLHHFATLEEAQQVIGEFIERYKSRLAARATRPSDPGRRPRQLPAPGGVISYGADLSRKPGPAQSSARGPK